MTDINKENNGISTRNIGVDLLKAISIFLIIAFHTLCSYSAGEGFDGTYLNSGISSLEQLFCVILSFGGNFGNSIFIISSAWYLLEKTKTNYKKWFEILFEVWVISITILLVIKIILNYPVHIDHIVISLFPTTLGANWFVSCYVIFYLFHKYLNRLINSLSKRELFRVAFFMSAIYIFLNFLRQEVYFYTSLMFWISVYFVVAYLKKYCMDMLNSITANIKMLIVGFVLFLIMIYGASVLANDYGMQSLSIQRWNVVNNIFVLMISLSLFNIFRRARFNGNNFIVKICSYISKVSLFMYVVHENVILRNLFRPSFTMKINELFGLSILSNVLLSSALIFLMTLIACLIYDKVFRGGVVLIACHFIFEKVRKIYILLENKVLIDK